MSTQNVPQPGAPGAVEPAADTTPDFDEIRVYSHSPLFYWWPVWLFGFIFSLITLMDNYRMAIVPGDSMLVKEKVGEKVRYNVYGVADDDRMDRLLAEAEVPDKQRAAEA